MICWAQQHVDRSTLAKNKCAGTVETYYVGAKSNLIRRCSANRALLTLPVLGAASPDGNELYFRTPNSTEYNILQNLPHIYAEDLSMKSGPWAVLTSYQVDTCPGKGGCGDDILLEFQLNRR